MKLAAILLLAASCWTDPPPARLEPPPPPQTATVPPLRTSPPTCAAAIAHLYDVLATAHDASFDALEPRFRDALVSTCEDMQWSGEMRACVIGSRTERDLDDCRDRMTQDQLDDIKRVLEGTP